MKEFFHYIFGEGSTAQIAATFVWAYLAAFTSILFKTTKRDPLSPCSPVHFSWSYLWSDNTKRIIGSIILIFIALRISKEFMGVEPTMYVAILIGYGFDKISGLLKSASDKLFSDSGKPPEDIKEN